MTYRVGFAGIVVALLLAGCGGASDTSISVGSGSTPAPSEDGSTVNCGGSVYDPGVLADAPPVSSLPEGPAGAVDDAGAPAFDPSLDWKVVHQSDDRVDLVRELDQPVDNVGGDVRTHASRTLELITDSGNVPDGWLLTSAGPCAQRLVTDGDLGDADLMLAETPSPGDTVVELRVVERRCASGQSAEGRIELVELTETADEVRLRIGVRPPEGSQQTCPGNPSTPFTVELSEPLGDRQIVDASVVPARPVIHRADGDAGVRNPQPGKEAEAESGSFHPDKITVEPEQVRPGGRAEVRFPEETARGIDYYLERRREVRWHEYEWVLHPDIADRSQEDEDVPGYVRVDGDTGWPDGSASGAGPDVVELPKELEPGEYEYRLCARPVRGDESDFICAPLTVMR